ncbi:unnamed protein product [Mytilus coruscus]|uniref:Uncharacterized protein n=1 Tax=Mytilus coruscus TaxID=42192 RepID=A0A6J8E295_MYTCO|nr:unnamed protein product [Mytilus coruscus]
MAMSTQEEEKERLAVSEFCEAILSTAVFECSLEDILDKHAAGAKRAVWKMELKRENKEEKKPEKDEDKEEMKPEMGVDISTKQRRELIITKIHEQRIGENPLKNAVGHVNKDPVQNSVLKGSINDKETNKDEKKKRREMMKEEKIRDKKAKEEEKIVQTKYKAIDKNTKKYTEDVKSTWKKEEKRRKQMKKIEKKAQKMLEKEMKKIEKERVKDEKKKQVQAIDVVQEKQNGFKIVKTNEETENDKNEKKKKDQTIDVDGETQNYVTKNKTKKEEERIAEQIISCDSIEKNEGNENPQKDAKDIQPMSTNNAGKKTTFVARISGFFRSLSCIKGLKKSKEVC